MSVVVWIKNVNLTLHFKQNVYRYIYTFTMEETNIVYNKGNEGKIRNRNNRIYTVSNHKY